MASSIARLSVSLTANTKRFGAGMDRARRSLFGFTQSGKRATRATRELNAVMGRMGRLIGGAAIAAGFINLARKAEMFNRALLQSQAIMSDLDDSMRRTMKDTAIEVARTTVFSAEEAARAYFFLASAGLSARQSLAALPKVARFAQAGMFDLADATDLLTDAQSALGLSSKDAEENIKNLVRVADVLVKANTLANASVRQFSESLTSKAGAAIKILGKDIEEGVAVLAAFADQGIKSAEAGTALNIVLRDLSTKAILNAKAFEDARVSVFDLSGEMRNIADIIRDLENALEGMSDAQAKATLMALGFADKSVIFIQTLLGTSEKIRGYEEALRSAGGTMESVAVKQVTVLQIALAELDATLTSLGESMAPFIEALAKIASGASKAIKFLTAISLKMERPPPAVFEARLLPGARQATQAAVQALRILPSGPQTPFLDKMTDPRQHTQVSVQDGEISFLKQSERDTIKRMQERVSLLDEAAAAAKRLGEETKKAVGTDGGLEELFGEKAEPSGRGFQLLVEQLERSFATLGLDDLETSLFDLASAFDASGMAIPQDEYETAIVLARQLAEAQSDLAEQTREAAFAFQDQQDMSRKAQRVFEQTRTPQEQFARELAKLEELFGGTAIKGGQETFDRAVAQLRERFLGAGVGLGGARADRVAQFREVNLDRMVLSGGGGNVQNNILKTLTDISTTGKESLRVQKGESAARTS